VFGQQQALADAHNFVAALGLVAQIHLAVRAGVHRQTRAAAVMPRRAVNRRQQAFRLHLANALQLLFKHALLHGNLRRKFNVLHRAAAAVAIMRASRRAPIGRWLDNLLNLCFGKMGFILRDANLRNFLRQRVVYKDGFAVELGNAARFII